MGHGVWVNPSFPMLQVLSSCSCPRSPSPWCPPAPYLLHCDLGIAEVHQVDVAHKGEGEGAGREVLWFSALHVVSDEQEDSEEDEEHLEGDAFPEEAQHGWMEGLCRDVSCSRSGQVDLTGHHPEDGQCADRAVGTNRGQHGAAFAAQAWRLQSESCFHGFCKNPLTKSLLD